MEPEGERWDLYGRMAPLYDAFYRSMDFETQADLYVRLHRRHGSSGGSRALDLCCGTGRHGARLASRGYEIVGYDRSARMLREASRRLPRLVRGDHRHLAIRGPFDLVLCVGHSLLQVQTPDSLSATLEQIHALLAPGGVFLCDMIDRRAALGARELENYDDELGLRYGVRWHWDGASDSLTTIVRMGIRQGDVESTTEDRHRLLALEAPQLDRWLRDAGFEVSSYRDDEEGLEPFTDGDHHALFAAVRPA